jgi:hypothetical protein
MGAAVKAKGVPVAAIVVPVLFVVLLILGAGFYFMRRRFVQNRMRKRNTWGAGRFQQPNFEDTERAYEAARQANVAPNADINTSSVRTMPPPFVPLVNVNPPQMSYNNPAPPPLALNVPPVMVPPVAAAYPVAAAPTGFGTVPSASSGFSALVRCTFIPTLPDELHISSGEKVRVLTEYDDGWALCENAGGEQGMVPLECLDQGSNGLAVPPSPASFRSKRASSLAAGSGIQQPGRY